MARGAVEHDPPEGDQKGQIGPRALTGVQIFIQHFNFIARHILLLLLSLFHSNKMT